VVPWENSARGPYCISPNCLYNGRQSKIDIDATVFLQPKEIIYDAPYATVLATLSLGITLAAADFTGTWKLNIEKSTFETNNLTSETMTISQTAPNAYTTAFDVVTKSGEKHHQEFNRIYDGKEHPLAGVNVKAEGISEICEQINASTRKITRKRGGKVTGCSHLLSPRTVRR